MRSGGAGNEGLHRRGPAFRGRFIAATACAHLAPRRLRRTRLSQQPDLTLPGRVWRGCKERSEPRLCGPVFPLASPHRPGRDSGFLRASPRPRAVEICSFCNLRIAELSLRLHSSVIAAAQCRSDGRMLSSGSHPGLRARAAFHSVRTCMTWIVTGCPCASGGFFVAPERSIDCAAGNFGFPVPSDTEKNL